MSASSGFAPSGALQIACTVDGDPDDPPLVLIAGLGAPSVFFEDEFVQGLVDRAFRVIRFDNRDCGWSSSAGGPVDLEAIVAALASGRSVQAPYRLEDMAADAIAVLDHLDVDRAHVLGVSLGGMIAQLVAIGHRDRVISLTSVSSTTGGADVGQPTPEAIEALRRPPPEDPARRLDHEVAVRRVWSTPGHFDAAWTRQYFATVSERGRNDEGTARQLAAILTAPDRAPALAQLSTPALVVHGTADPLIAPSGSARLHEVLADSELLLLEGMAHDLPPHYWAPLIEAVTRLAIRAR